MSAAQQAGPSPDILAALDKALEFAASKPEAAQQIAEALKSHLPNLMTLAHQGRLPPNHVSQLETLSKLAAGSSASSQPAATTSQWAPRAGSQPAARQATTSGTNGHQAYQYQEMPERDYLRMSVRYMAHEIDPEAVLEEDTEELLVDAVFDFIKSTTEFGSRLARHRDSDTLSVRDVQLYLERHQGIRVPGFATEETRLPISDLPTQPAPRRETRSSRKG